MAEPTLDDLRSVLRERADDVLVPGPPLEQAARRATSGRRRRALATVAGVAALAAAIAGVVVLAGPQQQSSPPSGPPSGTPSAPAVDELPAGPPTDIAYVVGRTLYVGTLTLSLEARVQTLRQVGDEVLLGYENGRLLLIRTSPYALDPELIAGDAVDAVLSPAGDYVVYQRRTADDSIVLVARAIGTGQELVQRVPARTACCDDPFVLDGITGNGVIGSLPAHGRIWWWQIERSGGALHARGLHEVTGIDRTADPSVDQVAHGHLVLTGNVNLVVGDLRADGRFVESDCCGAVRGLRTALYDLADPAGERVAFVRDGMLYFRDLTSMKDTTIALPAAEDGALAVRWEDEDHVLLVLEASTRSVLVRCSTKPRCELVTDVGGTDLTLAR